MKKTEKPEKNTAQITVTLPHAVYERLQEESEILGINRSAYITMMLKEKWRNQTAMDSLPEMMNLLQKALAMQAQGEMSKNPFLTDKK